MTKRVSTLIDLADRAPRLEARAPGRCRPSVITSRVIDPTPAQIAARCAEILAETAPPVRAARDLSPVEQSIRDYRRAAKRLGIWGIGARG